MLPYRAMSAFEPLPESFYRRASEEVARDLLGCYLVRRVDGERRLVLRLVEVEAYQGEGDRASHARNGPVTTRSRRLYRDGGHAYVYLIYGMHHCLNVVTGTDGDGSAVLIRAGEPVEGGEEMVRNRALSPAGARRPGAVAGGPGKLCQALGVDGSFDGRELWRGELVITRGEPVGDGRVVTGPRVGVEYAGEAAAWPLRFAVEGSPHVSKPRLTKA